MSSPVQAMPSPLLDFVRFLQHSSKGTGTITIPARTLENTKQYLSNQSFLPMTYVEGIVASIEHESSALCCRLDPDAFLMIYKILSLAEDCLAYQRGLFLLTQSLYEISTSSSAEQELRAAKKTQLGEAALVFLVGCFVKEELLRWTRRWMGVLALELLNGCDENKKLLLEKAPDDVWRCLGSLILDENCQILKLLAGFILHELWPDSTPTKELWPLQDKSKISRLFPKNNGQTSQWVVAFESFVVDLVPRGLTIEARSDVVFAYAVSVGEMAYCVNEESAILVAVSDELGIVIPATTTTTASYIDVCFNKIKRATIEIRGSQSQSSSVQPTQVLTIEMPKSPDGTFYVNARSHSADSVNLAFTSLEAASTVQQSLLRHRPRVFRDIQASQLSQAEPIDVSKHPRQTAEPPVARPAARAAGVPSNNLVNAASKANLLIEQDSITAIACPLLRKDDHEYQLNHLNQSGEQFWIPPRQDMLVPQFETFAVDDTVPPTPRQPTSFDGNTTTIEHDGLCTPEQRISGAPMVEIGLVVHADQCSLSKGYVAFRGNSNSAKSLSVEKDEDHDRFYQARPSAHNVPTKQANRSSLRLRKKFELQEPAATVLVPDSNVGNSSEQPYTKIVNRMHKTIVEVPIGPLVNRGASNADEKKVGYPKSAVKRKAPCSDKRDHKIPRFQTMVNPESGFRTVSADVQDGAEFDFPTSAHKTQESTTACLPTSTTASKMQSSSKTARKPKTKANPPSKSQIKGLSARYQAQAHEKKTSKEGAHSMTSFPSKKIRYDTEDSGTGQIERNAGVIIDDAKGLNKPQHESKKPSKRKSRLKTKHVKDVGDLAYSTKKAQNAPIKKGKRQPKAVPIPLAQSRNRRVAALTANEKIQDLVESGASEEEDFVETLSEKEKFTAQPDHKSGTSTSNLSISAREESGAANGNSRPVLVRSGEDEWQVMGNGQNVPMTKNLPREVSRSEENPRAESFEDANILANNLVQLTGGLPAHDVTDTRQNLRVTASNVEPFEDFNVHHAQSESPNAQLNKPPRQVNEFQDSISNESQEHLEGQDIILQSNLLHSNISFPSGDDNSATVPEISAPNNIDVLDGAGGGFFEEATAFSNEHAASSVDKQGDKEISEALALEDKHEIDLDDNRLKNSKSDLALRAAHTSTNVAMSTPKIPIAAKLQSALSSVESRHVQVTSQATSRGVLGAKSTTPSEAEGPELNSLVQEKTLRRGQDKFIMPKDQAIKPAIAQNDQDMMKSKAVPDPNTKLLDPEKSSNLSGSAAIAEHGKSSNGGIINEASPKLNRKPLTSTRVDRVAQTPVARIGERRLEGTIVATTGVGDNKHGLAGNLTRDMNSTGKADKASSSKSQANSFKEAGSAEIPIGARLDVNRKSNIISFDSKGPRNQGILSAQKAKATQAPESHTPLSRIAEDRRLKRKFQDLDADKFAIEKHVPADKRPRASEDVSRTREEAPKIIEGRKDSVIKESVRKSSSQSTRVDPNGSPMPFVHARKATLRGPKRHDSIDAANQLPGGIKDNDHEDDHFMLEGRFDDSNLGLPFLKIQSSPSATSIHFIPSSSSKHRPTSPNAPLGIIDEYAAHQVYSRGKFVDLQTDNVVMAVRPPDPFVGVQRDPTNNFLNRLRRLSDNHGEQNSPVRGAANNEDPEKTLIETSSAQKKHGSSSASSSGSSSDSSQSNDSSPSEDPSSSESGDDEDEWVKALKPHQGKTLEVLCEVSHRLVRNLVSKETAVRDIASGYSLGGNRLIDQFEESRRQDLNTYQTSIKTLEQKLMELYDNAQHVLRAGPKKQLSKSCAQVEAVWQDYNRSMKMKMEEALALCSK